MKSHKNWNITKTEMLPKKVPQSNLIAVVKVKFERMFVFGFFSNSFVTCHKEIGFFFSIVCRSESLRQRIVLFNALSHCDKQIFCLLHWVTVTNKVCICSGFFLKKGPKMQLFLILFAIFGTFCYFLAFCRPIFVFFSLKILHTLAFCAQYIPILFVAVTQCDKQKIHLSQWLSVTNKINLCHCDSVRQTILKKYPIYLSHVTKELEKKPKTNILSNLNFTTAIKLLWGTLKLKCHQNCNVTITEMSPNLKWHQS